MKDISVNRILSFAFLASTAIALLALDACGDDEEGGARTPTASTVNVELREWSVLPQHPDVAAGEVTLVAVNAGSELHELLAVKTDLGAHDLPRDDDGGADEHKVEVVGRTEPLLPGESANLVLSFDPGKYLLLCNIVETEPSGETESHYQQGMGAAFVVN